MIRFLVVLAVTVTLSMAACTKPAAPPVRVESAPLATEKPAATGHEHHEGDDAPRISLADAKKDFDSGAAVFIDTHSPEQFAVQHIPGAINITANDIGTKADKLPKGKKIIAYCS